MKHNMWFKNSANNYNNDYESVPEKGILNNVTTSSTKRKPKRVRSAFTTDQINYLEREYKKYPYIGTGHRKEIATSLHISERTVKIWFQNRRMKEKKETISKEFCDEQTSRQRVEFAKNRLNNVITMPSANEQSLNSLPLLSADVNTTIASVMNNKTLSVEIQREDSKESVSKLFQKPNLQKSRTNPKLLSFLKNRGLSKDSRLPAQSSIQGKKYMKVNNSAQIKSSNTAFRLQDSRLKTDNPPNTKIFPEDLSTKKSVLHPEQKACAGYGHGISGYVPVVSNFYPQPFMSAGGVLWKPVNVMSVVPRTCPTISSNEFSATGLLDQNTDTKTCNCNCHSKPSFNMGLQNTPSSPQYVFTTLPLQNPSTKF